MKKISEKVYKNNGNQFLITAALRYFDNSSMNCLDIGCGAGDNALLLKGKGFKVDGITGSREEEEFVTNILEKVFICNLEDGLPNEMAGKKYDLVLMSHVLEHIAFPDKLLNDIKSVINDNAKIVIGLPNLMHYQYRSKILFGNFDYENGGIMDFTHLRWYTLKTIKKTLEDFGFQILYLGAEVNLPSLFSKLPYILQTKLKQCLSKISPGLFGNQIVVVAKK